jgi:hypothetical protein
MRAVLLASLLGCCAIAPGVTGGRARKGGGSMFKARLRSSKSKRSALYTQNWVKKAVAKGAKDEKQRWAMFGDDGTLPRPVIGDCKELKGAADRVRTYPPAAKHVKMAKGTVMGKPRILCWVFTNVAFHDTKAKAVKLTWGKRCDGILFFSNLADKDLPSIVLKNDQDDDFGNVSVYVL